MSELKPTYEHSQNPENATETSIVVDEKELVFAALRDLIPRQRQSPIAEQLDSPAIASAEEAWNIRKNIRRATEA